MNAQMFVLNGGEPETMLVRKEEDGVTLHTLLILRSCRRRVVAMSLFSLVLDVVLVGCI
jgi:hypothetical protein